LHLRLSGLFDRALDSQWKLAFENVQLPTCREQKDRRIFVRGDKANSYRRMLEVMAIRARGRT
jgi:hypothetical protein